MKSPVIAALINAELAERERREQALRSANSIPPPRSWPAAEKRRFESLPHDLQVFVAMHEDRREKAIRSAHHEADNVRQALAKLKAEQSPETGKADATETKSVA